MNTRFSSYRLSFSSSDIDALNVSDYISNRRLLISLADAGGRLMYAYKDLLELAGLTTRIYTLLSTLHNLPPLAEFTYPSNLEGIAKPRIVLDGVSVRPPKSTEVLVSPLELKIEEGEHMMITGPVRVLS